MTREYRAIELSTEAKSSAPNEGAILMPSDIETTRVEDNRAIAHVLDLSASRGLRFRSRDPWGL